jgi:hypothetical protein
MIRAIRSYFSSLKASNLFGRASRLRESGRKEEALDLARKSLAVLRAPWVVRSRPAEGSVLLCTVMLVEHVASELNQPGAEVSDLADALANLKNLPRDSSLEIFGSDEWVPYLETRLRIKGQTNAV